MSLPTSEPIPFPEDELPPARRRRQRRLVLPEPENQRARLLDELGLRLTPGLEFFLSALLSGALFGLGLLLDAPALVILAVLLAPFMGPALGPALAAAAGSTSFLMRSLGWLLSAGLIYFLTGTLAGIVARILPPPGAIQAAQHLRLDWSGLLLLTVGVVVTLYLMLRGGQQKPLVSSVAVAYTLFLPLGAAGFALTAGLGGLPGGLYGGWLDGLLVFAAHLAWSALCGSLVLAALGLRPIAAPGYLLGLFYLIVCLLGALPFFIPPAAAAPVSESESNPLTGDTGAATAALIASETPPPPTPNPVRSTAAPTLSPVPLASVTPAFSPTVTPTASPTRTLVPTHTPTITVTPQATPVWARINAKGGDGAFIRVEPQYSADIVIALLNGSIVEVLPDVVDDKGTLWIKVRTADGKEGWIVRSLLATATPAPGW
jgi:hypothetical protein